MVHTYCPLNQSVLERKLETGQGWTFSTKLCEVNLDSEWILSVSWRKLVKSHLNAKAIYQRRFIPFLSHAQRCLFQEALN